MRRGNRGYYDIDVNVEESLVKSGNVDELFYLRDLKQRKLFLTTNT